MKIKTCDLMPPALDWAVGKAKKLHRDYPYSTDWVFGGPIIEREKIDLQWETYDTGNLEDGCWVANIDKPTHAQGEGPTPLIAAMRCVVASELGEEVKVPKELV